MDAGVALEDGLHALGASVAVGVAEAEDRARGRDGGVDRAVGGRGEHPDAAEVAGEDVHGEAGREREAGEQGLVERHPLGREGADRRQVAGYRAAGREEGDGESCRERDEEPASRMAPRVRWTGKGFPAGRCGEEREREGRSEVVEEPDDVGEVDPAVPL